MILGRSSNSSLPGVALKPGYQRIVPMLAEVLRTGDIGHRRPHDDLQHPAGFEELCLPLHDCVPGLTDPWEFDGDVLADRRRARELD